MTTEHEISETLDVKGLNCPMPVVKTKQATDGLDEGQILEVVATDSGSMSDLNGWAESTDGVELVDQYEDDEDGQTVYKHLVRKTA